MLGFAKKIGMTRLFIDGKSTAVTSLLFAGSEVVQTKTVEKDGYKAVQVGAFRKSQTSDALKKHVKTHTGSTKSFIRLEEFRDAEIAEDKKSFDINDFQVGDLLDITGLSIGRGFAGVVKRHGFGGQPKSHGHDHERAPGSIGSRWPQRVGIGKKMAGRMGGSNTTIKKAIVVAIDVENKLLFINGSLQGANKAILKIKKVNK
jgi:large subunit ribosomal protein L3